MYTIIAGGGMIGRGLIERLDSAKHDIVVIDKNERVCENIYARYGTVSVQGDATDLRVMEEAGIEKCDIAVSAMKRDADNLSFCVIAKSKGVKQIHARMNEPRYENAYREAGVDHITRMTEITVEQFFITIEAPQVRTVTTLAGQVNISCLTIPEDAFCSGMKVKDIAEHKAFPKECVIVGIYKEDKDEFRIPRGNAVLSEGDNIFISASPQNTKEAASFLEDQNR